MRDLGLVSFLTTFHKTMWMAKYNFAFVYEDDDECIEIGEQVIYDYYCKPVADFYT